ncbi:hypothetical protein MGYG_01896 [Nannizzia gypsea CBS 118893]|uniref:DUF1279 domain-containing protein n=1 Tax=Arthroderma gypseum (strain ATCC MYA-4604 / CBS 118893) TaxID=535722 RepID=E5QYL9_ARTGP|nr:hypothetical protein MGYG_01896 [Nannizzia gypsea CBS 118893]EFQ98882.1 hypothetical protein MGYG_01896 [Nannizzia gypsea CBS 118893]
MISSRGLAREPARQLLSAAFRSPQLSRPSPSWIGLRQSSRILQRQQQSTISTSSPVRYIRPQFSRRPYTHRPFTRSNSTNSNNTAKPSFSQRMRTLSREYGWAALGIYFFLSALDFPFCFAAVRLLGVDRIGHYEHIIVGSVKDAIAKIWPSKEGDAPPRPEEEDEIGIADDIEEAQKAVKGEASIWTQLALAYAIHKSFIFFRVPLTAAVTPKIVKKLRSWGWNIGKRKPKN